MPFGSKLNQLEPEFSDAYTAWSQSPTPQTTGAMLRQLGPAIRKGIALNAGGDRSPNTLGNARRLALGALRTYDPARASLTTHVVNNLQGLRRVTRQRNQVLRVPEQISLSRAQLLRASAELEEQLGREPNDDELGDYTGWSPRKLSKVRSAIMPVSEGMFEGSGGDEESSFAPATYQPGVANPTHRMLLSAVYADLSPVDKKIFEWTTGWNNQASLPNGEIAKRLGLSAGAISQRKARIERTINDAAQLQAFQ